MNQSNESRTIKASSNTYFLDLKETKDGKPFLVITQSRFMGEGKDRERMSITIFPDYIEELQTSLGAMVEKLK